MKTRRKLRTRLLALDFATPPNPVTPDRARAGFARMKETLAAQFAARGKTDDALVR